MMPAKITLVSINLGRCRDLVVGQRTIQTGFYKAPTNNPVAITLDGLAGDFIADRSRHGGRDQAVYLFSVEDAAWWAEALDRDITPGFFGENLTVNQWWDDVRIGDRLTCGSLTLEVSFPRIPCASLAARVGDSRFLKTFAAACRPGVYARVLSEGSIVAGDRFSIARAPDSYPRVNALFDLWHGKGRSKELLRTALAAPIAERARTPFDNWLAEGVTANES